jgi:SAM-dependent methyltransferase
MTANDGLAAAGFANASAYRAGRPNYPNEAVDYLAEALSLDDARLVVDLGAGTGIFTAQIQNLCRRLVAVEPSPGMREACAAALPGLEILAGKDTAVPFPDGSVDVITVAQAFHWFDYPLALAEFDRVLSPTGRIGLIWNERDESVPWVHAMSEAMLWTTRQPYQVGMDFTPILRDGPFSSVVRRSFTHRQRLTFEMLDERVMSTSYIQAMEPAERVRLVAAVREVVESLGEPLDLPYLTTTYVATR